MVAEILDWVLKTGSWNDREMDTYLLRMSRVELCIVSRRIGWVDYCRGISKASAL